MGSRVFPISAAPTVVLSSLIPTRKVMMNGERANSLAVHLTARAACDRKEVFFICADNRFDPYVISRQAKAASIKPEEALSRVLIARTFTAYQFTELISRLDPEYTGLVVISGPLAPFYDDDLSGTDAARLFYRTLWRLVELSRQGMTLLLAEANQLPNARRAYLLRDLCRAANTVLHLDGQSSFILEHRSRVALPYLASLDRLLGEQSYGKDSGAMPGGSCACGLGGCGRN